MNKATIFGVLGGLILGASISTMVNAPAQYAPDNSFCNNPFMQSVLISDAGTPTLVPFANRLLRRAITVCNSSENSGTPQIKCGPVYFPTIVDAGLSTIDAGWGTVGGYCYIDGGPSCNSTTTWSTVDGGPVLVDAGCTTQFLVDGGPDCPAWVNGALVDGGPCMVDGGPTFDAGTPFGLVDGGPDCTLGDDGGHDGGPCLVDGGGWACLINLRLTGYQNPPLDGGPTFNDGGPCLVDSGFCLFDAGQLILDAGPSIVDAGYNYIVLIDGGPDCNNSAPDAGPCLVDGGLGPIFGSNYPGDLLNKGDCITYPEGQGTQIICVGTQGTAPSASVTECQ